jgi:hypothetical protein
MIRAAVYLNLQCSEGLLYVSFHKDKMHCTVQIFFTLCDRDSGGSKQHVARKMKDRQNVMGKSYIFGYYPFLKDGTILLLCYFHYP